MSQTRVVKDLIQMATARLLGRTTAGTGSAEEISTGNGLTLSGGSIAVNAGTGLAFNAGALEAVVTGYASNAEAAAGTATNRALTPAAWRSANIVLDTAKASTSGTSVDFNGTIPSWAKRVTVLLDGVSTNGTSSLIVQLGDAGGIEATGYLAGGSVDQQSQSNNISAFTNGFPIATANAAWGASAVFNGRMVIERLTGNTWIATGMFYNSTATIQMYASTGSKTLSDVLDRVRITTAGGTDTFDAGTINISWE